MAKDEKELSKKDLEKVSGGAPGAGVNLNTGNSGSNIGNFGPPTTVDDESVTPESGGKAPR